MQETRKRPLFIFSEPEVFVGQQPGGVSESRFGDSSFRDSLLNNFLLNYFVFSVGMHSENYVIYVPHGNNKTVAKVGAHAHEIPMLTKTTRRR